MRKKILICGLILSLVVITMIATFYNVILRSSKNLSSEERRAMTYNEITDDDAKVDGCDYVQFSSFFIRDLDGDGYAEKYDGTCNEISKSATLYFDINVLTDGVLKNGKITVSGKNFNLQTALVKDEVLKNDYISDNTTSMELNDINYGTQKLFYGRVLANIGNNANNYSRSDNTVVLTGTWESTDGTQSVDINKTFNLTADWYGVTSTSVYSNTVSTTHDIDTAIGTDSINLSFNVAYRETAEQLLIQKQVTEVTIPNFNGYAPESVVTTSQNCTSDYNEETRVLTIARESNVSGSGAITNSISRINTYEVSVQYPLEAYESLNSNTISLTFPTTGYYYGYNNSNQEFQNPYVSSASRSYTHTWRKPSGTVARFDVEVGKYVYNPDTRSYRYVVSKELPLQIYNNLERDEDVKDEYVVLWEAYTGNTFTNQNGIYMEETQGDRFLNSAGTYSSMDKYIKTNGIYFSNADNILSDDGWIKVYDGVSGELLETFTSENWGKYNSTNPYYFGQPVDSIKVETSKAADSSYLYVYQIKEIDDELLTEDLSYEDFENLNYIYSYLKGSLYSNSTLTEINNDENYAYYEAPVSLATFTIEPDVITNQETKTVDFKITTESSRYNESKWQNGQFVIELPEEILAVEINDVNISDSSVEVISYESYEENGKQYIRIYTSNEREATYTLTVNADITADPRRATSTKDVKLYAINEYSPYYRTTSRTEDVLDINGNNNTSEYVLYKTDSLQIVAPSSLLTSQTLSNFDDIGTEVVSPQVAILDKSSNSRDARINMTLTNNYVGTISEIVLIGKIPFEGNRYQINDRDLGSTYSVTMKNTGIIVPEELADYAAIYYSTNSVVTKDLTDVQNNWKTADEVTDWSQIKTYAIDLSGYTMNKDESFVFSYDVVIPGNINYNDITYSTHAIYFCLDTEDGKLQTQTEVNRLGIMIAKKFDLNLKKYKSGTTTMVQGATYKVTDGETTRTGITNENGVATISGLYVEKEYTLSEIQSPSNYVLNENEVTFKVTVDDEGNPQITTNGTLRDEASIDLVEGIYTLGLNVEDIAKYDVSLVKTDSETGENLKGAKFKLTGGIYGETGRTYISNSDGIISMTNLVPDTEYTLQETKATGYYVSEEIITFTVSRNESGELEIISNNSNFTNANIVEEDGVDKAIVNVNLTNDKIPTYVLNLLKKNTDGEVLAGTQFKLTSIDTGEETYLVTDDEGMVSLDGLYQYVDGKYITGEYILQEISATEGYITDDTEVKFKAELVDGALNVQILEGETSVVNHSSNANSITLEFDNEPIFKIVKKGDNDTLLPNAKFKITDLDGNPVTDANGNIIGDLVGTAPINLNFTSTGNYEWTQLEDKTWASTGNKGIDSSTNTMISDEFKIEDTRTLSFEWSISSESVSYDYVYYTITNTVTGATIGGNTSSSKIGGTSYGSTYEGLTFLNVSQELSAGTYTISFTYRKDGSSSSGLDCAYVRNVKVDGDGYYGLTTDENGELTADLPEGLYMAIEVEAPEGYELPENEEDRIYYFGIGESRPEETEFNVEYSTKISGAGHSDIYDMKATDRDGGYITVGSFAGDCDVDNDGVVDITSVGDFDILVTKFDSAGEVEWYYNSGSTRADEANAVSVCPDGSGYIVAGYESTATGKDGVIIKLNTSGSEVWKKYLSGDVTDIINGVKVLSTGDIAVVGKSNSTNLNLGGGDLLASQGFSDGFVACYDNAGTYKWSFTVQGTDESTVTDVTETTQGIAVSVDFLGSVSVNGTTVASTGNQDSMVIALGLDGNYQWHQTIAGSNDESIVSLTTDAEDNVVAVGGFASNVTVGTGSITPQTTSYSNALMIKLASVNGEYVSNYTFGGTNNDEKLTSATLTSDGGLLLGGWFYSGSFDVNGDGTNDITSVNGCNDGIVVKLNDLGEVDWYRTFTGRTYDPVYSVAELSDNGYMIAGDFDSTSLSSNGTSLLEVQGYMDSYVIKLADVVTAAEVPELQEIEVANELKKYEITTEIDENSDGERTGGTITGDATSTPNINLVEEVKHGYDSTREIVITPDTNYSIYSIIVNGEEYEFIPGNNGIVTIPIFENVTQDYHVRVIFEKNMSSVLVHHYLKDRNGDYTTTSLADDEYISGKVGASYATSPKLDIVGYELEKDSSDEYVIPDNASGTIEANQIVVTYYYEESPVTLTVHHYLEGTEDSLADDENYEYYKGDEYETFANSDLLDTYELVEESTIISPDGYGTSGVIQENVVVTYYYKLIEHRINTRVQEITINRFNEITNETEEVIVKGGTISGEDESPYEIVIHGNDSTKDIVATPDEGFAVAKITVNGEEIDFTTNGSDPVSINKFTNVTEDKEVVVEFAPIMGTVIVHHYIENTTTKVPLANGQTAEDETKTGIVGDPYATSARSDIASSYILVGTPDNSSGNYVDGTIEVTYYYRLNEYE